MSAPKPYSGPIGPSSKWHHLDTGAEIRIVGDFDALRGGWPYEATVGERRRITDSELREQYAPASSCPECCVNPASSGGRCFECRAAAMTELAA